MKFCRLKTVNNAQHGEVEYVGAWVSQERQELAERAFRRWLLRKQSTDLQRAQSDLKAARRKREKVEAKIRIRLERLQARKESKLRLTIGKPMILKECMGFYCFIRFTSWYSVLVTLELLWIRCLVSLYNKT